MKNGKLHPLVLNGYGSTHRDINDQQDDQALAAPRLNEDFNMALKGVGGTFSRKGFNTSIVN